MILPIILSGGSGSRLWPLSRELHPKQFLSLLNNSSLLQNTINRLDDDCENPIIICNNEHRFIVAEQLRQNNTIARNIILEPIGKNTAPAIALAALQSIDEGDDPVLIVLAADHAIDDSKAFQKAIKKGALAADKGKLVTLGITPSSPETGYGYIRRGVAIDEGYVVESFDEKPNLKTAKCYLEDGDYLWNSGMFMFKASKFLEELAKYSPDILSVCQEAFRERSFDIDFTRIPEEVFCKCQDKSIDYAVMEHTKEAIVIPLEANWSDVGSFSSLWEVNDKDENNNFIKGDVISKYTRSCYINSQDRLIATVGVKDLVIVETKDAVLVSHMDKVQDVKEIVNQLKSENRYEYKHHREVYRPWGKYDSLDSGTRDQVKRITVKPGAKLSVQMHHHRSEHWVVVSGTAKVTNDDETFLVTENESTYIPLGKIHSLENPGVLPLELIEVQTGSYLGEDDIVRFNDKYGRE